ncbi:MAG TPA: drug/metabolite exporter YedA [Anaerolineales bacterium]|nr:drug/metabolite exporter YedA [Anaerolineales bacterium]
MSNTKQNPLTLQVILALVGVYIIWGSTYLGILIGLEGFSPFVLLGLRFFFAGTLLLAWQKWRKQPLPTARQWRDSAIVGGLMLMGGTGFLAIAEQWVDTGLASIVIATVPLWVAVLGSLWGSYPSGREWLGLAIGLLGIGLLNFGGGLNMTVPGLLILLGASINWAFGSQLSKRLQIPAGTTGFAAEMLAGGIICLALSPLLSYWLHQPLIHAPDWRAWLALLYLTTFGSMIGYSCYMYLFQTVEQSLATSYAYVNPLVAVLLGVLFAGEKLTGLGMLAMAITLCAVAWIVISARKKT